jgi:putative proteasome-type protease
MTYCLAITLDAGLVMASDSRTNAGVDNVSTYTKMHTFGVPGECQFILLSSGNLATTQAVINQLNRDILDDARRNLFRVRHLFEAAEYIGELSQQIQRKNNDGVTIGGYNPEATFLLGGQIGKKPAAIYLIYPQGNYIAASPYAPFLQIGESKYGKPILDRTVYPGLSLEDAARCALVSLDSTLRSNVSVGLPLDLLIYRRDSLDEGQRLRFEMDTPYYLALKASWSQGLRQAFKGLPRFDWEQQN